MAKSRFIRRDSKLTAVASLVCGVVFCAFSFTYLYCYQDDLLTTEQHVLSNGLTHYDRLWGAVIITVLLYLVHVGIDAATGHCSKQPALTYTLPAAALAVLTDIGPDLGESCRPWKWAWMLPLIVVLYAAVTFVSAQLLANNEGPSRKSGARIVWENLLIMLALFAFVCSAANTDRTFHQRVKIDCLAAEGKFSDALLVGKGCYSTDSSTTMLRAYALSKTGLLGERLFEYPLVGGSRALLPNGTSVKAMVCSDTLIYHNVAEMAKQKMPPMVYLRWMKGHGWAKKPLEDYLLTGYLLDKDIDAFAREFLRSPYAKLSHIPKHYREALMLYSHMRSNPVIRTRDEAMEADYQDFMTVMRNPIPKRQRMALAKSQYGNTYWFYYWN